MNNIQLSVLNQLKLRVNADPVADTGDSHAPVPFYVSNRGYGIFIDTARYVNVYMWLPVANIFGAIIAKIQVNMIQLEQSGGAGAPPPHKVKPAAWRVPLARRRLPDN